MNKALVSLVILTFNEEANIRWCLESTQELSDEIFIVDSFSTDRTLDIAAEYPVRIYQNPWTTYAGQRQWALANLPFSYEWLLFLDADERLTPMIIQEVSRVLGEQQKNPTKCGYYVPRDFYFLGKHLRWGYCRNGLPELRLSHRHHLRIGKRAGHEIYMVEGPIGQLKERLIHEDHKPLSAWIDRHNHYAVANADYIVRLRQGKADPIEGLNRESSDYYLYVKELFRRKVWNRLPIGFRPTIRFVLSYFFCLGFLDGLSGFLYIFLHEYWFQWLIDASYLELRRKLNK